jgi:hypothetical protein
MLNHGKTGSRMASKSPGLNPGFHSIPECAICDLQA